MKAFQDEVRASCSGPLTATGERYLSVAATTWWLLSRFEMEAATARKAPTLELVGMRERRVRQLHRELAWVYQSVRP